MNLEQAHFEIEALHRRLTEYAAEVERCRTDREKLLKAGKELARAMGRIRLLSQQTGLSFEAQSFEATEIATQAIINAYQLGLLEDKP